jgi:ubiquinone/menaquinone biosynthesis C-methylase UbiE
MTIYNTIGNNYNKTRLADNRILSQILSLINCFPPALIADIGAGTGNYSFELAKRGYKVHALEPSQKMYDQRRNHDHLTWYSGFAEKMPLQDHTYDGVICTMATHHFSSLAAAYQEMHRILKSNGRTVIFTADPRLADANCWLKHYFNPQYQLACETQPDRASVLNLVEAIFHTKASITFFPLPPDLKDGFFYSAWRYPEKYLDEDFINGISCFALLDRENTKEVIHKLRNDLATGAWDRQFGYYRKLETYNGGYYFLSIAKCK